MASSLDAQAAGAYAPFGPRLRGLMEFHVARAARQRYDFDEGLFSLTGNVGTYRGAHAAALQIGAMIGENASFNAGIATGFNKGGKFGARAGFSFGF